MMWDLIGCGTVFQIFPRGLFAAVESIQHLMGDVSFFCLVVSKSRAPALSGSALVNPRLKLFLSSLFLWVLHSHAQYASRL